MHEMCEALTKRLLQMLESNAGLLLRTILGVYVEELTALAIEWQTGNSPGEHVYMLPSCRYSQCARKCLLFRRGCAEGQALPGVEIETSGGVLQERNDLSLDWLPSLIASEPPPTGNEGVDGRNRIRIPTIEASQQTTGRALWREREE